MQEIFIGDSIREGRLDSGKTQEKLCDELNKELNKKRNKKLHDKLTKKPREEACDPSTLSRIETGRQAPSRGRARTLLQWLGRPHDRYYTYFSANEAEAEALWTEIDDCVSRYRQSLGEEKHQARLDALERLERLEAVTAEDDKIAGQYILATRAALGSYGFEERMEMLLKAIRLTVPRFDADVLTGRLYRLDEMAIINQIAEAYSEAGQHEKAAGMFSQLLTYVREHDQKVTQPSRYLSQAACNYAWELCLTGCYEKALEIAELGRRACMTDGYCQSLPGLLAVMAECRYALGEREQSQHLYRQAYYLYKETGDASGRAAVEEAARKRLGPEFPL